MDDEYALAHEPQAIAERLIAELDEFAHLSYAGIVCVFSRRTPVLRGAECAAFIATPAVQGALRGLFDWSIARLAAPVLERLGLDEVAYLVLIDAALWPELDPERRERLIYHELCHVKMRENERGPCLDRQGRPLLKLVPHDTEVFNAEVRKYGPEVVGLEDHCFAIVEGSEAARQRRHAATKAAQPG